MVSWFYCQFSLTFCYFCFSCWFTNWRITVSVLWVHCWIVALTAAVIDDPDRCSAGRSVQTSLQSSSGDAEVLSLWQIRACFTPHKAIFHCAHKFSSLQQLVSELISGIQEKHSNLGLFFRVIFPENVTVSGKSSVVFSICPRFTWRRIQISAKHFMVCQCCHLLIGCSGKCSD